MAYVEMNSVVKSFGETEVIHGVDLEIEKQEFTVFVGPSGCGKSTLLRLIAGLEELNAGAIHIGGERIDDLPPSRRGIAMVFQNYALYPHMSCYENMSFGLRLARAKKEFIRERVEEAADILQISELLDRKPHALSGGQRQRVAIARATITEPKVILADEPTGNLDRATGEEVMGILGELHRRGVSILLVTHDPVLGRAAERQLRMDDGRIVEDLQRHP